MEPGRHEHKGSVIELAMRGDKLELRIDGERIPYGRLPSGKYFLEAYAYDWHDDLVEVARRYIDYRLRQAEAR